MNTAHTPKLSSEALLSLATQEGKSEFDFIIVGSGAGGGPLACRLVEAGKRVLLIEAGRDPKSEGEVHDAPGYHGASTENQEMSWQFSVRHYSATAQQELDHKYAAGKDGDGSGGIFYPRSSGIGGCTSHHAMIVIRPNDSDWEHIADLTNDDSWRAKNMQPYFAKFEQCLYVDEYRSFLSKLFGWVSKSFGWLLQVVNPKAVRDQGGHGRKGWQPTSFIPPKLIKEIVAKDDEFASVLVKSASKVIEERGHVGGLVKRFLIRFGFVRSLDPNDLSTRAATSDGGVFLIPTGIGGEKSHDENGVSLKGRRAGVREFILKTQKAYSDKLVIASGVHVKRVLFDGTGKVPRAIGVETMEGDHLYAASPLYKQPAAGTAEEKGKPYYVKSGGGEVILCGGAFNTPQLLMLSGIGEKQQLEQFGISSNIGKIVDLPGVGRNLQDRYEVGVVSELRDDLQTLDNVSFIPGDASDPARNKWIIKKEGLYATNGGTVAVLQRSGGADGNEPDLFTFGAPAAFRGYYWNWSKELFKPTLGAPKPQHNLWTWVILKAYTRNNGGRVRLRSASAFDTPAINFRSFGEGATKDWEKDVEAMVEAVEAARAINDVAGSVFERELQPKEFLAKKNEEERAAGKPLTSLRDWIKNEAWGHHACGTCRIGADPWREDTGKLDDQFAVLDSHFRVHGVRGLRVVDASVFPRIPGYFILAPIFMMSEKAAETILNEKRDLYFPEEVCKIETDAILKRREIAKVLSDNTGSAVAAKLASDSTVAGTISPGSGGKALDKQGRPKNLVGLALSGGGVRSSTFSLGVVQALAKAGLLRHVDYLSSVSGGAFTGGFLGRLFTRKRIGQSGDPAGRAQEILADNGSGPLRWLRTQANYLFASGTDDWLLMLGIFFRNLFTVHLVIGALLLSVFGILAAAGSGVDRALGLLPPAVKWPSPLPAWLMLSAWWWVPLLVLLFVILPMKLGYWLAPKDRSYRAHPPYPLAAWVVLLAGASAGLALPGHAKFAGLILAVLGLAWLWQEFARRGMPEKDVRERRMEGAMVRNRLSRGVGEALIIFAAVLLWVALDSVARSLADMRNLPKMVAGLVALSPTLQLLRFWGAKVLPKDEGPGSFTLMKMAALVIGAGLVFLVDVIAHSLFAGGDRVLAWGTISVALAFSIALGRAFDFLNLTSLHATYSARISRTFLGASNEARTASAGNIAADVSISNPHDDVPHHKYRPEENGGPLHLISVCINETVDHASQREIREAKGLPMTIGSFGVSVGRRYFAKWTHEGIRLPGWLKFRRRLEGTDGADAQDAPPALEAIPLDSDPGTFHPLGRQDGSPASVQSLTLGEWVAVSGAAFSTGRGRATHPLVSLFMGLVNLRLGFWWSSGVRADERPGRFPGNLWRRLKALPREMFRAQQILLSEWRARFDGPSREFWNLTDGGHMDNSAVYELVRRKLPLIICTDATGDTGYDYEDFATLVRSVRVDFDAEIEWQDPATAKLPKLMTRWVNKDHLGTVSEIKGNKSQGGPGTKHAAIARITYAREPDGSRRKGWLLLIKASLTASESLDITHYAAANKAFPQDTTTDQIYDDEQWESYRNLGYNAARALFKGKQ